MRRAPLAALAAFLLVPSLAAAQGDRNGFVVTLGTDTVAVERVQRSAERLEGWHATRNPTTVLRHWVATLAPDGSVRDLQYEARRLAQDEVATKAVMRFVGDTVVMDIDVPRDTTLRVAAHGALPYVNFSYGLIEQAFRWAQRQGKDSLDVPMVGFGAAEPVTATIARRGTDAIAFAIFEPTPSIARVDTQGRILSLSGEGTTQGVIVKRLPDVDPSAVAGGWANTERAGQAAGQLSPLDSTTARVGAAELKVVYSRPSRRGRTIMGGVVPYDKVWRTGANAATMFTTTADLEVNGVTIPKGSYTLWTLPTRDGATLIVNRQTGQWGTEYDAAQDVARIPLKVTAPSQPIERFTFAITPSADGGTLAYEWGEARFEAPFRVKR